MPTLTQYRTMLGNLNGEENPDITASRDNFINAAIEDAWGRHKWSFRRATSNLAFSSTVIAVPADFDIDSFYDLREVLAGNDNIYTLIEERFKDNYTAGDYVCWYDGTNLNIHETDNPTLVLTYWKKAPVLTLTTDTCQFPTLLVARGAYPLFKLGEDDEYDTRIPDQKFEEEIRKYWRKDSKGKTKEGRFVGPTERYGSYLGRIK